MIRDIIKENMEYLNLSQKEIATKSNLSNQTISKIFVGERKPRTKTLLKLEKCLDFPKNTLINIRNNINDYKIREVDKGINEIATFLKRQDKFKLHDHGSLINIGAKMLGSNKMEERQEDFNKVSLGFRKFKDKPLAYLWLALLERKYACLKSQGNFKKSSGPVVIENVLDIMISEEAFNKRLKNLETYLDKNGIVIVNAPFIPDSTINGTTFKRNTQRFIFMSDMQKREYQYIFALIHELFHYYVKGFNDQDEQVASHIKTYLKTHNKKHPGLELAMDTYKKLKENPSGRNAKESTNQWYNVYSKTKSERIDFGPISSLLETNMADVSCTNA